MIDARDLVAYYSLDEDRSGTTMKQAQSINLFCVLAVLLSTSTGAYAAEKWSCDYAGFGNPKDWVHVNYQISGHHVEEPGTANVPFYILENNRTAIVASTGGSVFSPEGGLVSGGTILIIKRSSGQLVLGNVDLRSYGPDHDITTGQCRRVDGDSSTRHSRPK